MGAGGGLVPAQRQVEPDRGAVVDDGDLFGAGITEGDIRELLGG